MKNEPVNLTNLRSMTDGDAELEKTLFQEFNNSFAAGIGALENANDEAWRKQAHALKGISLSLGAEKLGQLSSVAQDGFQAGPKEKTKMLDDIKKEYTLVKNYLKKL